MNELRPSQQDSTPVDLANLRLVLAAKYPREETVLGSQLGSVIRKNIGTSDLKKDLGGLKQFVSNNFASEIRWSGRQGLDDVYLISIASESATPALGVWQLAPPSPASSFWAAATNPTVAVKFAWSTVAEALFQAAPSVDANPDMTVIQKVGNPDYEGMAREFAMLFVASSSYERDEAVSTAESTRLFARFMRRIGRMREWEEFRVRSAAELFARRLQQAGAPDTAAQQYEKALLESYTLVRAQRRAKTSLGQGEPGFMDPATPKIKVSNSSAGQAQESVPTNGVQDARAIVIATIPFLSEAELRAITLPLGAILQALDSLRD